ncbi:flavin reductase family protein [Muricoccus radiodurans]|uniref:flavin reductase family protein n=1 Tax=Muricoccus radiodurans TaxID=2231721 RepID=UPI003CEEB0A8
MTEPPHAADPRALRRALGCFATGVAIVTAAGRGAPCGLTINSFASLSLDPPLVIWSLLSRSPSLARFQRATHFAIHVLADDQRDLCARFATPMPDKFDGVVWSSGLGGAPLLDGCAAVFECANTAQAEGGDHLLFTGRVERFRHDERAPLIFLRGQYLDRAA